MKKIVLLFVLIFPLVFSACDDGTDETTGYETHPPLEVTTAAPLKISEMSPDTMDVSAPGMVEIKLSEIDFDSFEEIEAEDSVFPDSTHDKILKSEKAQYFFVTDDIKIHGVFFDEDGKVIYSASYNTETGYAEFIGDAQKSWYFGENGELTCFVYTYDFGGTSDAPIYTFYSPNGEKEVTRTMDGWYSPNLDILTNEEIMEYLEKYEGTIEATAEYKSSDITN